MNWKKIWYFIWKDDSMASWFVNVIIAIILVKFVIYPGLGLLLGTSFPVVAVVSCSMEHKTTNCDTNQVSNLCGVTDVGDVDFDVFWKTCGNWYEDKNIDKEMFKEFRFKNGFNKGDIMVLVGADNVNIGDVVVFGSGYGTEPIIHRVVDIDGDIVMTKGDHNIAQMPFERNINKEAVFGKAVLRIPYLGWVKVIFSDIIGGVLK
jgi:signal peptidase I